jgi:hypothetical protein
MRQLAAVLGPPDHAACGQWLTQTTWAVISGSTGPLTSVGL